MRVADSDGHIYTGIIEVDGVQLQALSLLDVASGRRAPVGTAHVAEATTLTLQPPHRLLRPLDPPEIWAAGVTYERSRIARRDETEVEDVYSLVYRAERPEVFLKDAGCRRTVGPGEAIRIRRDSRWTVPEPELALVLGADGNVIAVTAGNDVTARDIEAGNPLYLPQAKLFAGGCALGPAVLIAADLKRPYTIQMEIRRADGTRKYKDATSTELMRRTFSELASFICRDNPIPAGSVLLTGTGIVPPDDVRLEAGDVVDIVIDGIGTLRNPVLNGDDAEPLR